jgi:flagellar biosynthesis protein FlhB
MEGKDGRTERATPKRREEQRRKGNLCLSNEVISMTVLFLGLLGLRWAVPFIGDKLNDLFVQTMQFRVGGTWDISLVHRWFLNGMVFLFLLMLPVLVPTMLGGVLSCVVQTGPYLSWEAMSLKFSALNPVAGFRKLFSFSSVFSLILSLLKVALIVFVLYLILRKQVVEITGLPWVSVGMAFVWTFQIIFKMSIWVIALFIFLAVIDWCYHKYTYERNMMMTKKEVEDERKNQEPSPIIKGVQRRKMRELLMSRMMAAVPKASVVVTNPTHVAVALEYDPEMMGAPKVTAKGLRLVAERIKEIAREHGVPIVERPEVARELYKHVKVGREIPSRFYGAIAEILAFLYKLGHGRIREKLGTKAA